MLLIAIHKPSADCRLGISLDGTPEGRVIVSRVSPSGLFAGTKLKAGMEIVMVNDKICEGMREVSRAMQGAGPGTLTLQVIAPSFEQERTREPLPPPVAPPRRESSFRHNDATNTAPSRIQDDVIDPGAVEILLDPERQQPPPPPSLPPPARPLRKHSSSSSKRKNTLTILVPHAPKLGLRLQQDNRHVVVRQINPTSVFADTELRPGMRLIAMNDYDLTGCNVEEISELFRQGPREDGLLTLVVQERQGSSVLSGSRQRSNTSSASSQETNQDQALIEAENGTHNNNPPIPEDLSERFQRYKSARSTQPPKKKSSSSSLIRASIHKSVAAQPTGVRLKESPDRRHVRIDRIQPDSLFGRTALRVGMTVRRVNGIDCSGLTVQQVAQFVRETQGTLTIEASPAARESLPPRRP